MLSGELLQTPREAYVVNDAFLHIMDTEAPLARNSGIFQLLSIIPGIRILDNPGLKMRISDTLKPIGSKALYADLHPPVGQERRLQMMIAGDQKFRLYGLGKDSEDRNVNILTFWHKQQNDSRGEFNHRVMFFFNAQGGTLAQITVERFWDSFDPDGDAYFAIEPDGTVNLAGHGIVTTGFTRERLTYAMVAMQSPSATPETLLEALPV